MNLKLAQIAGIVRYEFRLHWRGRILFVIMLAILVLSGVGYVMILGNADLPSPGLITSALLIIMLIFLLPVVVSDTIPKDRQLGVRELLDALPVTQGVYLLGKLLGGYGVTFSVLGLIVLPLGIFYGLSPETVSFPPYLEIWFAGAVALVIMNTGLGVLLPTAQPNRRRAIILMVAVLALSVVLSGRSFQGDNITTFLNPTRLPLIMYYLGDVAHAGSMEVTRFKPVDVWLSIGVGLIEIVIVGVAVWAWPRWRENRLLGKG
ncbi:MAG: ABC transporter permease [Anaerolineaceae bacterium]|nr:ABC transporter permease [Anaerolineaceae bacterium]